MANEWMVPYRDRRDAGRRLATALGSYAGDPRAVVLALPRGGVPVAREVADALGLPLDVFLVRKLGVPGQEELAMGAIASGGIVVMNEEVVRVVGIGEDAIARAVEREERELDRRERLYRGDRPRPRITGRVVILVDDGLATGSTMRAAVRAVRKERPLRVVVAVPVAAPDTAAALLDEVDEIICPLTPELFDAVGAWYHDFSQTTDAEVADLLGRSSRDL